LSETRKKTAAIILAGGNGSRMGGNNVKQNLIIMGESVLMRSALAFDECPYIDSVIAVVRKEDVEDSQRMLSGRIKKLKAVVAGGGCRAESAVIGFSAIEKDVELIAIHDAARCLITPNMISKVVKKAMVTGAATAASSITDTVKRISDGRIVCTENRLELVSAQTPQVFDRSLYERALDSFRGNLEDITDDNMLLEAIGAPISIVDTGKENIKITTPEDFDYAEYLLRRRALCD